jgi:hypothetical protein
MQRDPLIRICVLCNLLIQALDELEADGFASPQLQDELRETGRRAATELNQPPERGRHVGRSAPSTASRGFTL